jgi:quercetin dioxygenase-like cupin family protein
VARRAEQAAWRDPATGYVRRNLSPPRHPSPIELVEVVLPAGGRVAYDTPGTRAVGVSQQVWIIEGRVEVTTGGATHALEAGDCLAMRLDGPTAFRNPAEADARYLVALAADPAPAGRGIPRGGTP